MYLHHMADHTWTTDGCPYSPYKFKQTTIDTFYCAQKGPLQINCTKIITKAENERLSKIYRNAKKRRPKVAPAGDLSATEHNLALVKGKGPICPQIIFHDDLLELDTETDNIETSQGHITEEATITKSKINYSQSNVSTTPKMIQSENISIKEVSHINSAVNLELLENVSAEDLLEVELQESDHFHHITNHIAMVEDIIKNVTETHLALLLFPSEIILLKNYQALTIYEKYFCCKLFTHQIKWYNIVAFLEKINLPINRCKIKHLLEELKQEDIIRTDYISETTESLLNMLSAPDIKTVHDSLRIKSKQTKKTLLISAILKFINTQPTLHPTITADTKIREKITRKLGDMVQINLLFYTAMYKVHLLYTYSNPQFDIPSGLYLNINNIKYEKITLPEYEYQNDLIFESAQEFEDFYKSYLHRSKVIKMVEKGGNVDLLLLFDLSQEIVKEFQNVLTSTTLTSVEKKGAHLKRYTCGHQYASALWALCKHLSSKYPSDVKDWMEMLLGQKRFYQRNRGLWYSHLSMIYKAHLKQNEKSVDALVRGLQDQDISDVDIADIVYRARNYCNKKSLITDDLSNLLLAWKENIPEPESFPFITINAMGNFLAQTGRGHDYKYIYSNGDVSYMSVEQIAIRHYIDKEGFTEGIHCEGAMLSSIFYVLFWDIIYTPGINYTFISKTQFLPLDFYSEDFYNNRKAQIDERLSGIKLDWTLEHLKSYIIDTWPSASKCKSLFVLDHITNGEKLFQIVNCIGRAVVSDICCRFVKNYRNYRAGIPDLVVYNQNTCKFVEVKGPGDTLSAKQKLWIHYLLSVGAVAEVCYVTKTGDKRGHKRK